MNRHTSFQTCCLILGICLLSSNPSWGQGKPEAAPKPNIIVIFIDDMGYGDIEPFGSKINNTPHLSQMAKEGRKLTSFYVASPVCTPSRAALMTGCYPQRVDLHTGSNFAVLLAADPKGLNPEEVTLAESLKKTGVSHQVVL